MKLALYMASAYLMGMFCVGLNIQAQLNPIGTIFLFTGSFAPWLILIYKETSK